MAKTVKGASGGKVRTANAKRRRGDAPASRPRRRSKPAKPTDAKEQPTSNKGVKQMTEPAIALQATSANDSGRDKFNLSGRNLVWSLMDQGTGEGFLYFKDFSSPGTSNWEFSPASSLFGTTFCQAGDANGEKVFGSDWAGQAIRVKVGDELLVRKIDDRNRLFLLRFQNYVPVENQVVVHRIEASYISLNLSN